jgi:Flp pilus assembly secretin CpaC
MKDLFAFLILFLSVVTSIALSDPPVPQVEIEANIVDVEDEFTRELGTEIMVGPTISTFTNLDNENNAVVPGTAMYMGISGRLNPVLSLFAHFNINQFGNATKFDDGFNRRRFTEMGVDAGIKLHFIPQRRIDGQILVGIKTGGITGGVDISKQNGQKNRFRFDNNIVQNKGFAGVMGGLIVMARTDVLDIGGGVIVIGGLTQLSDPIENQLRSVPLLVEIPLVMNFFTRPKHRERDNLFILLKPEIITEDVE